MREGLLKYHVAAILTIIVWGVSFLNTRTLLDAGLNPSEIYIMRFTLAYLGFLGFSRGRVQWLGWRQEWLMLLCGLTGGSIYFVAENYALTLTLVSDVAIIIALTPLLTVLVARLRNHDEPFTPLMAAGSLIALAGVAILTFKDGFVWGHSMLGDLLALVAALSWAFYSIIIKRLTRQHSTITITRKTFFYGLVTSLPLLCLQQSGLSAQVIAQPAVWGNIIYLALICSMAAFFAWGRIVKGLGAIKTNNYIYLSPVVSVISAALWLHERISPAGYVGCALILAGLILTTRHGNK